MQRRGNAVRAISELGARTAACQSGAHLAVEERARQQRQHHQLHLCAERQRREAVAATANHAYRLVIEHRERQRRATADEAAEQRAQWQAAAAAAGSRHGTAPGTRRSTATPASRHRSHSSSRGGSGAAVASAYPEAAWFHAASRSKDQARFWMLYAAHYRRLYGGTAPIDADDCWGRMAAAAAAAAADGGSPEDEFFAAAAAQSAASNGRHAHGANNARDAAAGQENSTHEHEQHSCFCEAASSAFAYWRDFARQAAAGFGFASSFPGAQGEPDASSSSTSGSTSGATGSYDNHRYQQQQQQQQGAGQQHHNHHKRQHWQHAGAHAAWSTLPAAPAGASLEQQVRAELAALLAASGGDLATFVSALGIPYERGLDTRRTLKNARRAAILSLHPDRLLQQGERQQLWGHHATMLVNELWHASMAA